MSWTSELEKHFTRDQNAPLPYPSKLFFICQKHKLIYAPIAKCACTALKTVMLELCELEQSELILRSGIHRTANTFNIGVQLKDFEYQSARKLLGDSQYYKFSVVRDPIRRFVSAYSEKFLRNRTRQNNRACIQPVVQAVRGAAIESMEEGITFREFAEYVLRTDAASLDPHWAPQHLSLPGVDVYNDIFTTEQLDKLSSRLSELTGKDIAIGKRNVSLDSEAKSTDSTAGRLVDTPPLQLDALEKISAEDFMLPDLVTRLEDYFEQDLELYKKASAGSYSYRPPQITLKESPDVSNRPLDTISSIARCINVYAKGYFVVDKSGCGQLQVLVHNEIDSALDFDALQGCYLKYVVRDNSGKPLLPPKLQAIQPGVLMAHSSCRQTLNVNIPDSVHSDTRNITISLQLGESFDVAESFPLHAASSTLVKTG